MEYGYARVSTKEQNELRQLIALREFPRPEAPPGESHAVTTN